MNKISAIVAIAGAVAWGAQVRAADRWIHVRVDERDEGHAHVDVQVPIEMVSGLMPLIKNRHGSGHIRLDGHGTDLQEMRGYWAAVRAAKDGEYVTVHDDDANVRVAKNGGLLLVNVDEHDGGHVRMKVPVAIVDAALGGGRDDVDVDALVRALASAPAGDLVTVEDEDSHVRIWIDDAPSAPSGDAR
ncbi:MAG TPA: hypothetical protein VFV19_13335 [Candidatus Polarisedimenticolaceae bacterium]|nr:hypothetical protein [Candidatus Polarisedimenticolaceae bacterium]